MSAFEPKRTWSGALHMFGFGGKAEMRGREASAHWWLAARDARYSFYPSQDPKLVQPHKCADVKQHRPKATPPTPLYQSKSKPENRRYSANF
jgi:hypothetical protein